MISLQYQQKAFLIAQRLLNFYSHFGCQITMTRYYGVERLTMFTDGCCKSTLTYAAFLQLTSDNFARMNSLQYLYFLFHDHNVTNIQKCKQICLHSYCFIFGIYVPKFKAMAIIYNFTLSDAL